MKEAFTDRGDELSFEDADDLIRQLGEIDSSVPRRTEGRKQHHIERYCIVRYLTALAPSSLLQFPFKAVKWESPDFLLHLPDGAVTGVEITEAGTEQVQRAWTKLERSPPGSFMEGSEIRLPGEELRGRGWAGNEPEQELTQLILTALIAKTDKLNRHYSRADRYALLIYDNSGLPTDLKTLVPILKPALADWLGRSQADRAFSPISVLRDSALLYDVAGVSAVFSTRMT